jgi:hypothetical protein
VLTNKNVCFFLLQYQRPGGNNRSCAGSWGVTSRRREDVRRECGRVNMVKYCVYKYVMEMTPVEIILGMGVGGIKQNGRGGKFMQDIFDIV